MIPEIPWYITFIVIGTSLAVAVAIWRILSAATGRSGLSPIAQRRVRTGAALFVGAWFGAALLLAPSPASLLGRDRSFLTPIIPILDAVSITIALLTIWRSSSLRRVIAAIPLPTLHALQVFRVIGAVFLILLAQGQVPAHFALPAGWGDVAVGLTAPLVALALARSAGGARPLAISWNVVGLLDLFVAVGMGTGFLAPILLGMRVQPTAAMGVFPMIMVPTFAVPMSMLLHLIALSALSRDVQVGTRLVPTPAR